MESDNGATAIRLAEQAYLLLEHLRHPEAPPFAFIELADEMKEWWETVGALAIETVATAKNLHFTSLAKVLAGYGQGVPEVFWANMPVADKLAWEGVARFLAGKIDGEEEWTPAIDVDFWKAWHQNKVAAAAPVEPEKPVELKLPKQPKRRKTHAGSNH